MKLNRKLLLCTAVVTLLLVLLLPFRPYMGREVSPVDLPPLVTTPAQVRPAAQSRLDVNTAAAEELQSLPGIGPARAQSIVDHRNAYGPFQSVEELTAVDGIHLGVLEQIRDLVCVTVE